MKHSTFLWIVSVAFVLVVGTAAVAIWGSSTGTFSRFSVVSADKTIGKCFTSPGPDMYAGSFGDTLQSQCQANQNWGMWCRRADVFGAGFGVAGCTVWNARPVAFTWPTGNCTLKDNTVRRGVTAYDCFASSLQSNPWKFFEPTDHQGQYLITNEDATS